MDDLLKEGSDLRHGHRRVLGFLVKQLLEPLSWGPTLPVGSS